MSNNTKKVFCVAANMFAGMVINPIDHHEAKVVFLKYLKELHSPAEYLRDYSDLSIVETRDCYHVIDAENVKQLRSISVIETNELRQTVENLRSEVKLGADCEDRLELCEDALRDLGNWAKAYPLDIFPEPDLERANELLQAGGMTIDVVSASAMRHLLVRVQEIVKKAVPDDAE